MHKDYTIRKKELHNPRISTGKHTITAKVEVPNIQEKYSLDWEGTNEDWALHDIVFLISLFTRRNVFLKNPNMINGVINQDPRQWRWGILLKQSIIEHRFEEDLNYVYNRIRNPDWQKRYSKGYFLFILRSALQPQSLESTFILCFSIWEHLYTLDNPKNLKIKDIWKVTASEKIKYVTNIYSDISTESNDYKKIVESICNARNRTVHIGRFPDSQTIDEVERFIYSTEKLTTTILGLKTIHGTYSFC
jgi:hypothetical protein